MWTMLRRGSFNLGVVLPHMWGGYNRVLFGPTPKDCVDLDEKAMKLAPSPPPPPLLFRRPPPYFSKEMGAMG